VAGAVLEPEHMKTADAIIGGLVRYLCFARSANTNNMKKTTQNAINIFPSSIPKINIQKLSHNVKALAPSRSSFSGIPIPVNHANL